MRRNYGFLRKTLSSIIFDFLSVFTLSSYEFLKQLLAYYEGKIVLIEDGAPSHGSHVVKELRLANVARLTIEKLPAFSPDYNPSEKRWKNTKPEIIYLKL